jgi:hypothetical protein
VFILVNPGYSFDIGKKCRYAVGDATREILSFHRIAIAYLEVLAIDIDRQELGCGVFSLQHTKQSRDQCAVWIAALGYTATGDNRHARSTSRQVLERSEYTRLVIILKLKMLVV